MNSIVLTFILALATTHQACAVTAKDVFPGNGDSAILKGEVVRKGTIAATIANILNLDKLLKSSGADQKIRSILKDQRPLSRGLYATDFFELQPFIRLLGDSKRPGKVMIAVLTLQTHPELVTDQMHVLLQALLKDSHPLLQEEIRKLQQTISKA